MVGSSKNPHFSLHFNMTPCQCHNAKVGVLTYYNGLTAQDIYSLYPGISTPSSLTCNTCFQEATKAIAIPIKTAAVKDTTSLAFFDALGELEKVKAYIPSTHSSDLGLDVVSSPCLQHLLQQGHIRDHNFTEHSPSDYDAFFVGPFDSPDLHDNNSVIVGAILDPGPLHRAEWIKFVAAFLGKESEANEIFEGHRTRYDCLKKSVVNEDYKKIAWFDEFSGTYYATTAKYLLTLFDDARAFYTPNCTGTYSACSAADIATALQEADVVVTTGVHQGRCLPDFINSLVSAGLPNETVMSFPSIQASKVYNIDKRQGRKGGLDWFEGAIIEPDVVLLDIIAVLHPKTLDTCRTLGSYKTTWLRNIETETASILTSEMCTNTSSYREPLGSSLQPCECIAASGDRTDMQQYKNISKLILLAMCCILAAF